MADHDHDHQHQPQNHHCGSLFGCGEEQGNGVLREDIKDAALTRRTTDRLLHMDEMDQATLDGYLSARGRSRRALLRASSFMGALAAVGPWFTQLVPGKQAFAAGNADSPPSDKHPSGSKDSQKEGRDHAIDSTDKPTAGTTMSGNSPRRLNSGLGIMECAAVWYWTSASRNRRPATSGEYPSCANMFGTEIG